MKKIFLLFFIAFFLISFNSCRHVIEFDAHQEVMQIDAGETKEYANVVLALNEATMRAISGIVITWKNEIKLRRLSVVLSKNNQSFIYGSKEVLESLKGLEKHKIKISFEYDEDTEITVKTEKGAYRATMPALRVYLIEDLGKIE